jgi:hypothetical protein
MRRNNNKDKMGRENNWTQDTQGKPGAEVIEMRKPDNKSAREKETSSNVTSITRPASSGALHRASPYSQSLEDQIRQRAYYLYEARGRGDGLALEDWLRAEEEILGAALRMAKAR